MYSLTIPNQTFLPHDNLRLEERVSELGVLCKHSASFMGIVLNAHLHLLHELEHLLWR